MSEKLTPQELLVLMALSESWNHFVNLPPGHPDDQNEFKSAIHAAQNIIASRVARRVNPSVWR